MSQITLTKPDNKLSIVGKVTQNPIPSKNIGYFLCPICKGDLKPYTRCIDCKHIIQLICYKCQWESKLLDHNACHKNVFIKPITPTNFQNPKYSVFDELKNKADDLYHLSFQMAAPVFNLVH